ncbi:hypothetical protein OA93_05215 [Flavobacterium sp. KMS]|uniref:lipocalin family protein n=1 Tax=Flavobacterium sp. KMS TaxID=1566023 RepID=UPI00057DE1E3|nr:lipocalin family protein [Flavobacterium sp. KMS]KIA99559.1 hypothetical protein OA93_05215 [Flavobacterium sp. KMS]
MKSNSKLDLNKKNIIFFILIITLIFASCSKNDDEIKLDPENTLKENTLKENVFIINSINIISSDDNSFVLNGNQNSLKVNDIVLSAPSSNCPYGMIRKITAINNSSNGITFKTIQSNLNEAFDELHIDTSNNESYTSGVTFKNSQGSGSKLSVDFNDNVTIAAGIKMNGSLKFNIPTTIIKYEKEKGSLKPKLVLLKAELNSSASLIDLTYSGSAPITVPKKIIKSFDLLPIEVIIPITTPIGIFPLPVIFKHKIDIEVLPFTVNGKFNLSINPEINAVLGCKYENDSWSDLSSFSINASSATNFSILDLLSNGSSLNANLVIFNPRYEITPLYTELLKGYFEVPNSVTLKIQNPQPNYSLKYDLTVNGGIQQFFWTGIPAEFKLSSTLLKKTIKEGNWNSIIGNWKMSGNVHYGVDCWNIPIGTCVVGTNGSCIYSIPQCVRDDISTYTDSNNFIGDEGATKCSNNDPQTVKGTYTVNNNQLSLNLNGENITYNILQLDATTLKIQEIGYDGYEIYTRQ